MRELIRAGGLERHRAQEWVEDLVRQTRERSEALVDTVRNEVRSQVDDLGLANIDDLAKRVADRLASAPEAARRVAAHRGPVTRRRAERKATAKKATAKKATAKKATAKKATAKKATVAKRAPGRASANKASAR